MDATTPLSLFLLALLGTGHCVGMCGPLVLGLMTEKKVALHLLYHFGRITTYSLIGLLLGALSAGFGLTLDRIAQLQVAFSLLAALFMILFGLVRLGLMREPALLAVASPLRIPGFRQVKQRVMKEQQLGSVFLLGMMLGFLPCGLSYAAFAMSLTTKSAVMGALSVFAFGLGTLPGLLIVGTSAHRLFQKHRRLSDLLAGVLMVGMGVTIGADALLVL